MFLEEFKEGHYPEKNLDAYNQSNSNELDSPIANTPLRILTANSLIGEKIQNPKGEHLGTVKDIMFDIKIGCIDYLVIEFGGILGMGEKLFAIPFQVFSIDTDKKLLILERSKESLQNAPGFDKNHWPGTNSRHFDEIHYFWGYMGPFGNDYNEDEY